MLPVITLWTKKNCQPCNAVRRFLTKEGVEFEELSLEDYPSMVEFFAKEGLKAAPVTEYDGEYITEFRPTELKQLVEKWRTDRGL